MQPFWAAANQGTAHDDGSVWTVRWRKVVTDHPTAERSAAHLCFKMLTDHTEKPSRAGSVSEL